MRALTALRPTAALSPRPCFLNRCSRPQTVPVAPRRPLSSEQQPNPRALAPPAAASMTPLVAAVAGIGLAALAAWLDALMKSRKPDLTYAATPFNAAVLSRCPTLHSVYRCTPFLTNGHVETIVVAKTRRAPGVDYKREILLTKDGGAVAVDWEHFDDEGHDLPADAPVLILFPGLTGGSGDSYVQHAVLQARHAGIRAAVFNSRGTADSPVITPQFYSASFTGDTREVIDHVRRRYPASTLFAAGWSLGANILVNYLGEEGPNTPLEAAVSMCNPFDLTLSNTVISQGFNKIYDWNLAASLKRIFLKHELVWRGHNGPAQPHLVPGVNSIREFDEAITVHSFSWDDVDAYYAGSSSSKRIPDVAVPLLCIQALDDPIAPAEAIPHAALAANPNCVLAVTPGGGHLGWASGPGAPFGEPWTDGAIFEWLSSVHTELLKRKAKQASSRDEGGGGGGGKGGSPQAAGKEQLQQEGQRPSGRVTVAANSSSSAVQLEQQQQQLAAVAAAEPAPRQAAEAAAAAVEAPQLLQQQEAVLLSGSGSSPEAATLKRRRTQQPAAAAEAAAEAMAAQLRWAF